jgi:hypothetical protein
MRDFRAGGKQRNAIAKGVRDVKDYRPQQGQKSYHKSDNWLENRDGEYSTITLARGGKSPS